MSYTVRNGQTLDGIVLENDNYMIVYSGGTANSTTVESGGRFGVSSGGKANDTTVKSGGNMTVASTGAANATTVHSGGHMTVSSGGTATEVLNNGGFVYVEEGATVTIVPIMIDRLDLDNWATIHSGMDIVGGINIFSGGQLHVSSGGTANNVSFTSKGVVYVSSGGTASNVSFTSGGSVWIFSGGKLTGQTKIVGSAEVYAYNGAIIDFDISELTPGAEARISDFFFVRGGTPVYTLTISDTQIPGKYSLAEVATEFTGTLLLQNVLGEQLGSLMVNGSLQSEETSYRLRLEEGSLTLAIQERDFVPPTVSNIRVIASGPTNQPVVITADFADNEELTYSLYRIGEDGEWLTYEGGITLYHNTSVYLKAVDFEGNESEVASCTVSNIGNLVGLVVSSGMSESVFDGETFIETTVMPNGIFTVESGGIAADATVSSGGSIHVSAGGTVDGVTISPDGRLYVESGGTAQNIAADSGVFLEFVVAPDTCAAGTSGGMAFEIKDGSVSHYMINGGRLSVSSGGTATGTTVEASGRFEVCEGGAANDTTVNSDGSMSIVSAAKANDILLNSGGHILVSSGGTATGIVENGGYVEEEDGADVSFAANSFSGLILSRSSATIHSGTTANKTALNSYGSMYVCNGGLAEDTTVNSGGRLYVSSGGTATSIMENGGYISIEEEAEATFTSNAFSGLVLSSASATVHSGTTANETVLNSYGSMCVCNGGLAEDTTVNSGGQLYVSSGGTANNTMIDLMGTVYVFRGGVANSTTVSCGGIGRYRLESYFARMDVSSGGTANNTILQGVGACLAVSRGGVANSTTVDGYACNMVVQGSANDIDIQWGYVDVSGGTVNNVMVNSNAGLYVYPGCLATGIVENGGFVDDFLGKRTGGSASFVSNTFSGLALGDNRWATVHSGTTACDTTVAYMGWLCILSGGIAYDTVVQSGFSNNGRGNSYGVHIFSGGTANGITVNPSGYVFISSGGTAVDVTLLSGGSMVISSGTVNNIRITDGARLTNNRGSFTGRVLLQGSSGYSIGNWFTYDLTQTSAGGIALLNDLSLAGGGECTVTVADDQAAGIYSLADGADTFDGRFSLYNISGRNLRRSIALGETVEIGNKGQTTAYTFFLSGGDLYLAVDCDVPEFAVTSGATVTEKTVVNSGEIYDSATVSNGGSLQISSGGTAARTIVNAGRTVFVNKDGLAKRTQIKNGHLYVFGGMAVNTVISRGSVVISGGGSAYNTTVRLDGTLVVSKGGTADDSVLSGGSMLVSGGAMNDTIVYNGQGKIEDGGVANRTMLYGGAMLDINSGGIANHAAINESAAMNVSSGGTANSASVSSRGSMYVSAGVANNTTVFGGSMTLDGNDAAKGAANATILYGAGRMNIRNGGVADDTTVYGMLTVSSGGMATNVKEAGGYVDIKDGAVVAFASNTFSGRTFYGSATVHSGTTAVGNIVFSSAKVEVFSGGIVERTLLGIGTSRGNEGGNLFINSGGTATDTNINGRGSMFVSEGGAANDIKVNSGGFLYISSGAGADHAVVNEGGKMFVQGGTVNNITVNSRGSCSIAGVASGITVNSAGSMFLEKGGRITGKLSFANRAFVSAGGGTLDFDLTRTEAGGEALVNDLSIIQGTPGYTLTVDGTEEAGVYSLADGAAAFTGTISVVNKAGDEFGAFMVGETVKIGYDSYTLNLNEGTLTMTVESPDLTPQTPVGTRENVSWAANSAEEYVVEYSTDNFEHVIQVVTNGNGIDTPDLPAGTYQWRVKADANSEWAVGEAIMSEPELDAAPKVVQSNADGNDDLFFATASGTWENIYYAQHVGSINDWTGTNEIISASGKGRIQNLFFGSSDPNVLCLTDGENGDAIFVDDVYTELPESVAEHTARLYKIQEIRAGAGDDIVDMTSQRFEYVGDGLTIRGGDGNDTIWATKGNNFLFGDAGNDRIVGASGNDVIAGGIGIDRMQGGGGDDIFTFCDNWGEDTVEQLADGSVTLWFASGDESKWNAEKLTYTDGDNSVTVKGVASVTLKFGDDGPDAYKALAAAGAFAEFTSQKIFEESGKGLLA